MPSLTLLIEACLVSAKFEFCLFDIIIFREFVLNAEQGDFVYSTNLIWFGVGKLIILILRILRVILENLKKTCACDENVMNTLGKPMFLIRMK